MSDLSERSVLRALAAGLILVALLASCGESGTGASPDGAGQPTTPGSPTGDATTTATADRSEIAGITRDPMPEVGALSLPEITTEGQQGELFFRADPSELLLVYFGYTSCPDVCPTTLADLKHALEGLGPDADRVTVAMVTVDPERDTSENLPNFLEFFVGDRGRALRTDDFDRLGEVEDAFLTSSELNPIAGTDEYEVVHGATVHVVDEYGRVVLEWPFGTTSEVMQADLAQLLEEAA